MYLITVRLLYLFSASELDGICLHIDYATAMAFLHSFPTRVEGSLEVWSMQRNSYKQIDFQTLTTPI